MWQDGKDELWAAGVGGTLGSNTSGRGERGAVWCLVSHRSIIMEAWVMDMGPKHDGTWTGALWDRGDKHQSIASWNISLIFYEP